MITVSKGNLFKEAFVEKQNKSNHIPHSVIDLPQLQRNHRLNLNDFNTHLWDQDAETFFEKYPLTINKDFWLCWRNNNKTNWRSKFSDVLTGSFGDSKTYLLLDDKQHSNEVTFEAFKVFVAYDLGMDNFRVIYNHCEDRFEQILQLRLEVLRKECDRYGGPEKIPISTGFA